MVSNGVLVIWNRLAFLSNGTLRRVISNYVRDTAVKKNKPQIKPNSAPPPPTPASDCAECDWKDFFSIAY